MNQFDRREFIKLSILTTGGISLYPNIIFASELRKLTFDEIPDYSIKSSSLSLSKLLLSKTGKTPAELSINFQNYENESGIDSLFTSKINEIDSKIATNYGAYSISRNPNLSEKEFQETLNTITTISRAGFVATLVGGSFLINPVVGAWLASAIGGGIVYDVVKDWVIVDDENNEIDIENFNASLNKLEIEVKNTQNSIDEYSKKTNEELNSLGIKISQSKEEVKAGVIDQSESVKKLVEKKFSENNDLINKLGKNVSTANNKLDIANTKLNLINANIDLTNQNIFKASQEVIDIVGGKVDTVGKYVFLNLPPKLQMQALNDRDLKFVKDLEKAGKLSSTKQDLQKVIDSQEFEEWYNNLESKFNSANKIIGETYQAALALGLKGKDAERAGRVVQWAGQLTSIALSFASSNPIGYVSGVIQSIGFIGGLFGKRKKEDPVLKALQQISTQLNKIHKDMVSGFNHLDKKLDKLAELNVELYQNIVSAMEQQTKFQQKWFIHISNELAASRKNQELILRKQNDILEFIKNESEKEIGILRDYEKDRIGLHGNYFANYEDYLQTYNNVTGFSSGLIALNSIVSNIRNNNELSYFSIIADKISDNPSLTYFEVTELYEPCKILFDSFYEVNKWQKIAFNSLLLPTYKLNDNNQTYDLVNNLGELSNIHKISKLDRTYLSPNSLATISHLYITYCHYFEIQKNTTTVEPGDYNYYLELDDRSKEIRVNEIIKKLESLLDLTNRGIAQQAVMSGHLLLFKIQNILYNGLYPELYDKVIGALRSNYILSHNFVKYLLHPKLDSTNKIEKYKNAFKANSVAILSGFLNYEVSLDDNQKLQIQLTSDFKTYLPNSKEILNNEMLYPSDLELLLATKQKLIQKKMDMEFGKAFA